MAGNRRRNLASSRRRVDEEGEDEDVGIDEVDDSQSDASLLSDDQASSEGSELSEAEETTLRNKNGDGSKLHRLTRKSKHTKSTTSIQPMPADISAPGPMFTATADMDAMANGLGGREHVVVAESVVFEDDAMVQQGEQTTEASIDKPSQPGLASKRESYVARARRETEGPKDKGPANPAFVPNRGGFFMHDYRNESGNQGGFGRGRGRAAGPPGNAPMNTSSSIGKPEHKMDRWDHDLHEAHADGPPPTQPAADRPPLVNRMHPAQLQTAQHISPSQTISLGTVLVRVLLPSMGSPINFPKTSMKQYTRLPDLRPPLRRDKPVRISLPGLPPKYVFPNHERSFVFIPRSQRPNQQSMRSSIRANFQSQGSRRASAQAVSSTYASSVTRSRRSSQARDGIISPSGSVMSKQPGTQPSQLRPVVKLPAGSLPQPTALSPPISAPHTPAMSEQADEVGPLPPGVPQHENHVDQLPMHQPRPQKTVSVASIESPAPLHFHTPMQQEQQPFHHQVPAHMSGISAQEDIHSRMRQLSFQGQIPSGTPLSHIAERALHAQPFQPSMMQQAQYYQPVYPMQNYYYYPQLVPAADAYGNQLGAWNPMAMATAAPTDANAMAGNASMYAHESNGMVYYIDQSQVMTNADAHSTANYEMGAAASIMPGQDGYTYNQAGQAMIYYPAAAQ